MGIMIPLIGRLSKVLVNALYNYSVKKDPGSIRSPVSMLNKKYNSNSQGTLTLSS